MKRDTKKKRVYKSIEEFMERFYPKSKEDQSQFDDPSAFGARAAKESLEKCAGTLSSKRSR